MVNNQSKKKSTPFKQWSIHTLNDEEKPTNNCSLHISEVIRKQKLMFTMEDEYARGKGGWLFCIVKAVNHVLPTH